MSESLACKRHINPSRNCLHCQRLAEQGMRQATLPAWQNTNTPPRAEHVDALQANMRRVFNACEKGTKA
jgi:hypothetical protein